MISTGMLKDADSAFNEGLRRVEKCTNNDQVPSYFRHNFVQIRAKRHTRAIGCHELDGNSLIFWCTAFPYQWWRPRKMRTDVFHALLCKVKACQHVDWPPRVRQTLSHLQDEFGDANEIFGLVVLQDQYQLPGDSGCLSHTVDADTSALTAPVGARPQQKYEISPEHFAKFLQWANRHEPLQIVVEYGEPTAPPYIVLQEGRVSLSYSLSAVLLRYVRNSHTKLKSDDTLVLIDGQTSLLPSQT